MTRVLGDEQHEQLYGAARCAASPRPMTMLTIDAGNTA